MIKMTKGPMAAETLESAVLEAVGGRSQLYVILDAQGRVANWSTYFAEVSRTDPRWLLGQTLDPAAFAACLGRGIPDPEDGAERVELPKGGYLNIVHKWLPSGESVIAATAKNQDSSFPGQVQRQGQGTPISSAATLARIGHCVWDLELGRSRSFSADFSAIHGLDSDVSASPHVTLEDFLQKIHPNDRCAYSEALSRLGKGDATYDLEFRIIDGFGRLREVREVGDSSNPEAKAGECAVLIAQDITDIKAREIEMLTAHDKLAEQSSHLKKLATQLEEAKREAVGAATAKSDFLANISHELRTPLNAILGFSEIMKSNGMIPITEARFTEYASDIHASGLHLLHVIDDVLDISKLEAGHLELKEEVFSLSAVVSESLRLVSQRAKQARIRVVTDLSPNLPKLYADRRRIKQVLLNLLSNAVKFTPEGGSVTVSAGFEPESRALAVCVTDTGIGMSAEDIPVALAPFYQVGNVFDRKFEGTGLGLPLSKDLIELHGGSLSVQSVVGKGTRVLVMLPESRLAA